MKNPMTPEQVREALGLEPVWRGRTTRSLCEAISAASAGNFVLFVIHRFDRRQRVLDLVRAMLTNLDRTELICNVKVTSQAEEEKNRIGREGVIVFDGGQSLTGGRGLTFRGASVGGYWR